MAVALISHVGLGPVFLHSSILSVDSVRSRPSARCSLDIRSCLFRSSHRGFKQEGSTDLVSLCRLLSRSFACPAIILLAHPSFTISFIFGFHQGCFRLSFQLPPIFSSRSRCSSPPLGPFRSPVTRRLRKETSNPEPSTSWQPVIYPASLLSPSSQEPRIANRPRLKIGIAGVSRACFHSDRDRCLNGEGYLTSLPRCRSLQC